MKALTTVGGDMVVVRCMCGLEMRDLEVCEMVDIVCEAYLPYSLEVPGQFLNAARVVDVVTYVVLRGCFFSAMICLVGCYSLAYQCCRLAIYQNQHQAAIQLRGHLSQLCSLRRCCV